MKAKMFLTHYSIIHLKLLRRIPFSINFIKESCPVFGILKSITFTSYLESEE